MSRPAALCWIGLVLGLLTVSGCHLIDPPRAEKSLLSPLQASQDSVVLEVFFARCAYGHPVLNGALWQQINEQAIPAAARRALAQDGLRVGIAGTQVPAELANLLNLTGKRQPTSAPIIDLESEPTVTLRTMAVRSGRRSEIVTSPQYERLPLLTHETGSLEGHDYFKAEGRFCVRATAIQSDRMELDIVPELQHGEPRRRSNVSDGVLRLETARPKHIFEKMRVKTELAPGQMLVMTCLPDRPGSLGHSFFTEQTSEALVQKIMVLRMARAGWDHSFAETVSAIDEEPLVNSQVEN